MFKIRVSLTAATEIGRLKPFARGRVMAAIRRSLSAEPAAPSRNRKLLEGVAVGFEHVPPVWELRVGDYRVFYDVDVDVCTVWIRAVRFKGRGSTEEVL